MFLLLYITKASVNVHILYFKPSYSNTDKSYTTLIGSYMPNVKSSRVSS